MTIKRSKHFGVDMKFININPYTALLKAVALLFLTLLLFLCFVLFWAGSGIWFWGVGYLFASATFVTLPIYMLLGPGCLFIFVHWVSESIHLEYHNVQTVGPKRALWVTIEHAGFRNPGLYVFRSMIWAGHDPTGAWLEGAFRTLALPQELQDAIGDGIAVFGSVLWSRMVVFMHDHVIGPQAAFLSLASFIYFSRVTFRINIRFLKFIYWYCMVCFVILFYATPEHIEWAVHNVVWPCIKVLSFINERSISEIWTWAKWRFALVIVGYAASMDNLNRTVGRYHSKHLSSGSQSLVSHFRQFSMQAAVVISDLGLPSFVRRRFSPLVSETALADSLELMASLGWPVNVDLDKAVPVDGVDQQTFKEWILCGSSFKQGIHNCKVYVDQELRSISSSSVYRRTEEYASVKNEFESTSRYFKSVDYSFPNLELDDVWTVVGDIFRNSRLTPFNYIIGKWEKKYALGSFMTDPVSHLRKYSRKNFIRDIGGYGPFKRLWARTFYYATHFLPVSAVSVKGEALPERKWAKDKVRSIIGSPITQYILSTIWNYGPNHRFSWESTPIKLGMPLNGYWMSSVWARHARCQIHVQGDFESFDSTVSGKVHELIKAVRKKGFEFHKDREAISELIDVNYEQVVSQLLNTTSNGNIYKKGTGLTTGHSSTSMDNSLALVILYLMAWKDLTGLSAKEFLYFNEVSCFGDDHVLSSLATKPAVWTPKNIRSTMKRWGLVNNLDVKSSLDDIEFLAKRGRKAKQAEISELSKHGLGHIRFLVWHDKDKLVGKLTAKVRNLSATYRLKRLISYLSLTAHHEDLHKSLVNIITGSKSLMAVVKNNKVSIPSYTKVLQDWYSPTKGQVSSTEFDDEVVEAFDSGKLLEYGATNAFDSIIGALSMVPDLLSPIIFNFGYNRAFQLFLKNHIAWVVDFICITNSATTLGAISGYLRRTPYRWVEPQFHVPGSSHASKTSLLVRHWLYVLYVMARPTIKVAGTMNFVVQRLASAQFLLNGKLFFETKNSEFQLDLVLVAALLSFVDVPEWLPGIFAVRFPDLQLAFDLVSHFLLVSIWTTVPPNFRETTNSLRAIDPKAGALAISAPTGTGKSTALIQHIANVTGHKYRKIIVIEPRTALVVGLVSYMDTTFGMSVSGSTTGLDLDRSKKVFYMTPQALLGHVDMLNPENLFVLDEAHLDEEYYVLLRSLMFKLSLPRIYVSATLSEPIVLASDKFIEIPIAQVWGVTSINDTMNASGLSPKTVISRIVRVAVDVANSLPPGERGLFFLPRIADVEAATEACTRNALAVHGAVGVPEHFDCDVVFSTNICDVGITIPGVTFVWTSSVSDYFDGALVRISPAVIGQRKGRTGRTNNGVFSFLNVHTEYGPDRSKQYLDVSELRSMVSSGLPIELAMMYDKKATFSALGFDCDGFTKDQVKEATRGLCVFFRNFQPVYRGFLAAAQSSSIAFGKPAVLHATGIGNISSSFPQPGTNVEEHILALARETVLAGLYGNPPPMSTDSFKTLSSISGPVVAVKNLVFSLANDLLDGSSDMLNPKNSVPSGSLSDVYEVGKIMRLLQKLQAEEDTATTID